MRIGLCTGPENLEMAGRLGFDYIECAVTAVESMSDSEFDDLREKVAKGPIKPDCFNVLFPGTMRLIGPEADHGKISVYLEKAFDRVKALGGRLVVFGSGRSRAFPSDMPYCDAFRELINVSRLIGENAAKHGITIAIEPLNTEETNCVNSVREGAMLEAAVSHASVGLLADLYHILKEDEPLENMLCAKKIIHTHIARLEGRSFPTVKDKNVEEFLSTLKQIGYNGTMSIEGKADDLEADAAASLVILRGLANC